MSALSQSSLCLRGADSSRLSQQVAKAAIRQIRDKGYADQYKGDKRPVTLVGINFRSAKRNIDELLFAAL